jgi:hypothetical protein
VKVLRNKNRWLFSRTKLAATGRLQLGGCNSLEQGGGWQEAELELEWHSHKLSSLKSQMQQVGGTL